MENEKCQQERIAYCPFCDEDTKQMVMLYEQNDPKSALIWECHECGEVIDFL